MKKTSFLFIFIFCFINCFSQDKRHNNWYFGNYSALTFNTTPPSALTNSAMQQIEGCASISDNTGALLFYTNGVNVWNRNHQVMPNGTGLFGAQSASQSALILPKPNDNNLYYLFTVSDEGTVYPFSYSIIDMTSAGGLGDVVTKNVALHINEMEKLTATVKSNGIDYWIVIKDEFTDAFYTYSLTAAGVDPNPVVSHVGLISNDGTNAIGYARISPDGSKLCIAYNGNSPVSELFDFDNSTGILSNRIGLADPPPTGSLEGAYGVEFSPDNSKLYIMQHQDGKLMQYDLSAGSATAIQNSATTIIGSGPSAFGGAIQLGPDNKIYIVNYALNYLSVINQPNLAGAACNFILQAIIQPGGTVNFIGLPNDVRLAIPSSCQPASNITNSVTICGNQTYQLPSGTIVVNPGIYHDTIRNHIGTCDSIITTVNLSVFPVSNVNATAQICSNQTYQLPSGTIVNTPGIYLDTLRSVAGCDSVITTVNLSVFPVNNINTAAQICSNQTYQLPSGIIVNTPGVYLDTLRGVAGCDSLITTVNLSVVSVSNTNASAQICSNQTYQLPSGIIVNTSGIYLDTIRSVSGCDSIINTIRLLVNATSSSYVIDSLYESETYTLPSGQTVNAPGLYQTVLVNSVGCDSVIITTLKLITHSFNCITLRNAITPNGDGINDLLILYGYSCFKRMEMHIFNRYGQVIYYSDDYKNDWNGKYKNKELPDGTYYYVIKVISFDGKEHVFKDNVTILR